MSKKSTAEPDEKIAGNRAAPTESPVDELVGIATELRRKVEEWNAAASVRIAITARDEAVLKEITDTAEKARVVAGFDLHSAAAVVIDSIAAYIRLATGTQKIDVGGTIIEAPAVESAAVRAAIKRAGQESVLAIEKLIAVRQRILRDEAERQATYARDLKRARAHPTFAPIVAYYMVALAEIDKHGFRVPELERPLSWLVDVLGTKYADEIGGTLSGTGLLRATENEHRLMKAQAKKSAA